MDEDQEEQQESGNENEEADVDESNQTINISDIRHGSLHDNIEYDDSYTTVGPNEYERKKRGSRQKFSQVWTKFTIVNHRDCIATCNICGARLSFKTTITNLSKHITRKHNYNAKGFKVIPFQQQKKNTHYTKNAGRQERKRTLTELGGLDGLLLNVVANDGEDPLETVTEGADHVNNEQVVYAEEVGEYTYTLGSADEVQKTRFVIRPGEIENGYNSDKDPEYRPGKDDKDSDDSEYQQVIRKKTKRDQEKAHTPTRSTRSVPTERRNLGLEAKKERMIDLQLECLELKKYNMQLEALSMEHQLCMPRSIFTEPLRGSNNLTRGTQTDVGGGNTKVFYVSDKNLVNGDQGSPQLFTFQARISE